MRKQWLLIFLVIGMFLSVSGCASKSDDDSVSSTGSEQTKITTLQDIMADQGLELIKETEVGGDRGYLMKYTGKYSEGVNSKGISSGQFPKYCMVLTGSAYNMGYQAATLRPEQGYSMLTDYMKRVALQQFGMLGINLPQEGDTANEIYNIMYDTILDIVALMKKDIPSNLRKEMQGFADGMQAAGYTTDPNTGRKIDYNHLLVINEAVDSTYFFLAAVLGYAKVTNENKAVIAECRNAFLKILVKASNSSSNGDESVTELIEKANENFTSSDNLLRYGCNELVVSGNATATGETYHGRDFMFSTGDIYQDAAAMVVYLPDEGYPFVTVSVPGFIGQSVGLNIKGLSVGQDVCLVSFMGKTPGVGSMFMVRDMVQKTSNISEAVELVRNTTRGVSWIYFVASDEADIRYGHGAELSAVCNQRDDEIGDGIDTLPQWIKLLYSGYTSILDKLDADELTAGGDIDRGVMVRGEAYEYPADDKFASPDFSLDDYSSYKDYYNKGFRFTAQKEAYKDALAATNHYITPRMRMMQFQPLIDLIYAVSGNLAESVWRYENMISEINEYHGSIEYFGDNPDAPAVGSVGWMIDFLNTQRSYPWFYRHQTSEGNYQYPVNTWVDGHHAAMNNTRREMRALYGYMTDPWVGIKLQPFVDWYYGADKKF
ncbi:MAG TPA: hypothetical protein VIS94_04625 [Desulfomonilia bacterium]